MLGRQGGLVKIVALSALSLEVRSVARSSSAKQADAAWGRRENLRRGIEAGMLRDR